MNQLYYGDNLLILRNYIKDESVDLIYLDPPFNSNANYNVLFRSPAGEKSHAQIEAFEDTWHWTEDAEIAFDQVMQSGNTDAAELLRAMRAFLKENDMMAYLTMMAVRLLELHRVLKPTGSLYLHYDPTASHYLKIVLDAIFGPAMFQNEIVWKRTTAHSSSKRFGPVHDVILYASRSAIKTWNQQFQTYTEEYLTSKYSHVDAHGKRFRIDNLTAAGKRNGDSGKPWKGFDPDAKGRHWAVSREVVASIVTDEIAATLTTQKKLDVLDSAGFIH